MTSLPKVSDWTCNDSCKKWLITPGHMIERAQHRNYKLKMFNVQIFQKQYQTLKWDIMSVYTIMCIWTSYMPVGLCGRSGIKLRCISQELFSLSFWGNISLRLAWMELMDWAKLADQREAGGLPVSILHCWNCKHASPHLGFTWMLRVKCLSSCFHDKHVISPPVSLAPKKLYWKEDFAELLGCDDCYLD